MCTLIVYYLKAAVKSLKEDAVSCKDGMYNGCGVIGLRQLVACALADRDQTAHAKHFTVCKKDVEQL